MTEEQRETLIDIFDNHEALDKISIELDSRTKSVVIKIDDLDSEWFNELEES